MQQVEIDGEPYNVYADIDTADLYLAAAVNAATWRLLDTDSKARALITSTRTLDRQVWLSAYATQEDRESVQDIIDASIELANVLVEDVGVLTTPTTAVPYRSITAGSVSITNFRGIYTPSRFPLIVQELLRPYMSGSGDGLIPKSTGTDGTSIYPLDLGFNKGL